MLSAERNTGDNIFIEIFNSFKNIEKAKKNAKIIEAYENTFQKGELSRTHTILTGI